MRLKAIGLACALALVGYSGAEGPAGAKGDTGDQGASGVSGVVVPGSVLINLNINADDTNGASTRSLMVIEADTDQMWNFPFT
ncbi:MAG: hypothetical protein V3U93_06295, partial [Alphaproteobacteria bacterium]